MKKTLGLSVEIGGVVYEGNFLEHPKHIIGYHIGKMVNKDKEGVAEDRRSEELNIEYEGYRMSGSSHILEFGKRIFLARKKVENASQENSIFNGKL